MTCLDSHILYYQHPTGALVSKNDYSFMSTIEQNMCIPVYKKEFSHHSVIINGKEYWTDSEETSIKLKKSLE